MKYGKRVIAAALTGVLLIGAGQVGAPEISSKGKIHQEGHSAKSLLRI